MQYEHVEENMGSPVCDIYIHVDAKLVYAHTRVWEGQNYLKLVSLRDAADQFWVCQGDIMLACLEKIGCQQFQADH